jgi:hypothetical protein
MEPLQEEAARGGAAEDGRSLDAIDEELTTLLEPERRRQQREMSGRVPLGAERRR